MNIELILLKLLFKRKNFLDYSPYLRKDFIEDNSKELGKLFHSVEAFHEKSTDERDIEGVEALLLFHFTQYPATTKKERDLLQPIFDKLKEINVDEGLAHDYLRSHIEKVSATEFALKALEVADGKADYSHLIEMARTLGQNQLDEQPSEFVSDDLDEIYHQHFSTPGLRWRLKTLNRMLGSIRKGNFGFIFKRPETGGTTLLASEVSFMAQQVDRPIIWFNNEQVGAEVQTYIYRAHFGCTTRDLFINRKGFTDKFRAELGGRIRIYDRGTIHRRDVDTLCSKLNPSLILFDQIDKIKGFNDDRNDLELKAIYQWARELAKEYGPVIGVCQAGGTAEGKRWLTMDDVDSSKTSKQGEADWILGIGKTHEPGMENIRHFHLCKNKLIGDEDTDPSLRHGKQDVRIRPEIARYEDIQ